MKSALRILVGIAILGLATSCQNLLSIATTYNVVYLGNGSTGGSPPADSTGHLSGSAVTILGNNGNLVRTGYAFTGWNTAADGSGTSFAPGSTFTIGSSNQILYAQWAASTAYTIVYNGNGSTGGTVPVDGASYASGAQITVLGNTGSLVKTGYTFAGWNTSASGTGAKYPAGATLAASANVTLYAMWTSQQGISMSIGFDIAYSQLTFSSSSVQVTKGNPVTFQTGNQTLAAGASGWRWLLDGVAITGQTAAALNLNTTTVSIGSHTLTVYTNWQGLLYSANIGITVSGP